MKINELEEGIEYWVFYKGIKQPDKYRINRGFLEFYSERYGWRKSEFYYNAVLDAEFEPCEWMPKKGEFYYLPSFENDGLYTYHRWENDSTDNCIKRNVGVYRTREEAIAKAKELGWT